MRKNLYLTLLIIAFCAACSSDNDGGGNPFTRGTFTADTDENGNVITKPTTSTTCTPTDKINSKLKAGVSITKYNASQDYNESMRTQVTTEKILSVAPTNNSYVKRITVDAINNPNPNQGLPIGPGAWAQLTCTLSIKQQENYSYSNMDCEVTNSSFGISTSKTPDNSSEEWVSCSISNLDPDQSYSPVTEVGTMTLANGKQIKAERQITEYSGTVTCATYKDSQKLKEEELGHGMYSRVRILSDEIPETYNSCEENLADAFSKSSIVLDDGRIINYYEEEVLRGNF